jgi:hypothetical protein
MLFIYCYVEVFLWQQKERFNDFRANVMWIRKNGEYTGHESRK